MNKIAILTDTHFGVRNDSQIFLDYFQKFFDEIFWPTISKEKIKHIIHLGDLVDRRKFINFNSLKVMQTCFLDKIEEYGCHMTIIPGNHDSYYKNTIEINAVDEILSGHPNVTVINCPTTLQVKSDKTHDVLLLPWICEDNYNLAINEIEKTTASICMGHLELTGFKFNKMHVCEHGMSPNIFDKFKRTFSGHFHHKSNQDDIYYLGAPYEMTWDDWNDTKGFHLYNFEKDYLEFVENPFRIHEKLVYDDRNTDPFEDVDFKFFDKKIVKVIVTARTDNFKFGNFIEKVENSGAYDVKIIESKFELSSDSIPDQVDELQETLEILKTYINNNDIQNKDDVRIFLTDLYKTAITQYL